MSKHKSTVQVLDRLSAPFFNRLARKALQQQGYPSIFDQKLRPHHTREMGPKHEAPVAALRSACCLVL